MSKYQPFQTPRTYGPGYPCDLCDQISSSPAFAVEHRDGQWCRLRAADLKEIAETDAS